MKHPKFLRCMTAALALILVAAALPFGALAAEAEIIELVATDITLDETRFQYTGEEIRPNVTVRVRDQLLTLDKDYTLEFRDNIEVGTAAVVVTGIATSGYSGTVEHPFYIEARTEETPAPIAIKGTDVTIDGTSFPATGEAIEPAVTVTVEGKTLTAGEEYTLVYENNVQPGTASVTVTGVEDKGYTGTVIIHYTIEAPETKPEETQPEETQPEETKPVSYKITKGNGASWNKGSGKDLSFTADGAREDFTAVLIDGKKVNSTYFALSGDTVVTLDSRLIQSLDLGKHTVTVQFADGEATGTFTVAPLADDSNPKTGDEFALHAWTAVLFVSLVGITGTVFAFRTKIFK